MRASLATTPQGFDPVDRQGSSLGSDALHPDGTRSRERDHGIFKKMDHLDLFITCY